MENESHAEAEHYLTEEQTKLIQNAKKDREELRKKETQLAEIKLMVGIWHWI